MYNLCAQYCFGFLCLKYYFTQFNITSKTTFKMSKQWQPLIQIYTSSKLGSCPGRQREWTKIGIWYSEGFPDGWFQLLLLVIRLVNLYPRNCIYKEDLPSLVHRPCMFSIRSQLGPQALFILLCRHNRHTVLNFQFWNCEEIFSI